MKLVFIHPGIGKIPGQKYLRAWQMESLPIATLASLTPKDISILFFDDRMEDIDYNVSADLVAITVETYTAKRAYQIASEYRRRNIPVVMGGFHATLFPDEVLEYADAVLIGEAEGIWDKILDDFAHSCLQRKYQNQACTIFGKTIPDRTVFAGKNYLKIGLLEAGRGCRFRCDFCSIQKFFRGNHSYRDINLIKEEILAIRKHYPLLFFVDDNITANHAQAKQLFEALIPLKIKWVGQADITIANDSELLKLMAKSGCQGVLIGIESLNQQNLKTMNKAFNFSHENTIAAIKTIHKHGLRLYVTFLFGYENDTEDELKMIGKFCTENKIFMAGFNHLTPFPGTDLYKRLENEHRLLYEKWWLNDNYIYGRIPFKTPMPLDQVETECHAARKQFYSIISILFRMTNYTNISTFKMFWVYLYINLMLRKDAGQRLVFPMGDLAFKGQLLKH